MTLASHDVAVLAQSLANAEQERDENMDALVDATKALQAMTIQHEQVKRERDFLQKALDHEYLMHRNTRLDAERDLERLREVLAGASVYLREALAALAEGMQTKR